MKVRRALVSLTTVIALVALAAPASAAVVKNGGFESGTFSQWTTRQEGAGGWEVTGGDPEGACPVELTLPIVGGFTALANMGGESRMVLFQKVTIPAMGTPRLMLDLEYDSGAPFVTPNSLASDIDNQQLRIDLMRKDAKTWSASDNDVLRKVFRTEVASSQEVSTSLEENLRTLRGKTVKLRIAVVATDGCLAAGVDAVRIN